MTPKEKAEELVEKYINLTDYCDCLEYMCVCFTMYDYKAKQCALIAVEEILNTLYSIPFGNALDNELEYWEEVKQEIEKLQIMSKYFKPLTRIKKVIDFYYKRGVNSERVNNLYRKILRNE